MRIDLIFPALPDKTTLDQLERWLTSVAPQQTGTDGGRILWIASVPGTHYRPFAKPQPFTLRIFSPILSNADRDAFQIAIGCSPRKWMTFECNGNSSDHMRILLEVSAEISKICRCLICFHEGMEQQIAHILLNGKEKDNLSLARFPGQVYEVAREDENGGLIIMLLVDARCLSHWYQTFNDTPKGLDKCNLPYAARTASLDY